MKISKGPGRSSVRALGLACLFLGAVACTAEVVDANEGPVGVVKELLSFGAWSSINTTTTFTRSPSITVRNESGGAKRLDVFARRNTGEIWRSHKLTTSGSWSSWQAVSSPAVIDSRPSAAAFIYSNATSQVSAVAGQSGGNVYINLMDNSTGAWIGWQQVSPPGISPAGSTTMVDGPALIFDGAKFVVFARRASDNMIYWASSANVGTNFSNTWNSGWHQIPNGTLESEPAVARKGATYVVVARGLDDRFWLTRGELGAWSSWANIGTATFGSEPAVAWRDTDIDVFGLDATTNKMKQATFNPMSPSSVTFSDVVNDTIGSGPGAVAVTTSRTDIVARSSRVYHTSGN